MWLNRLPPDYRRRYHFNIAILVGLFRHYRAAEATLDDGMAARGLREEVLSAERDFVQFRPLLECRQDVGIVSRELLGRDE